MKRAFLTGLVVVGVLAFTGCSDKNSNKMITGRVIDHYLKGATVTTASGQKATTDKWGRYTLVATGEAITAKGGVDIATGEKFLGVLKSPAGSRVTNSLTTMTQSLVEEGKSLEEAKKETKKRLGVPENVDITSFDPIEALAKNPNSTTAKTTLAKQAQVQAVLNSVAEMLSETNVTPEKAFEEAAKALTKSITAPEDMQDATKIETIIKETAKEVGKEDVVAQKAAEVASKVAAVSALIEDAKENDPKELIKTAEAAVKVASEVAKNPDSVEDVRDVVETVKETIKETIPPKDAFEEIITGAQG